MHQTSTQSDSRREFLKKTAYMAPVILTLKAAPAFASQGSYRQNGNNGIGNGIDPQPPGDPKINDGPEAFSDDSTGASWNGGPEAYSSGASGSSSTDRRRRARRRY